MGEEVSILVNNGSTQRFIDHGFVIEKNPYKKYGKGILCI